MEGGEPAKTKEHLDQGSGDFVVRKAMETWRKANNARQNKKLEFMVGSMYNFLNHEKEEEEEEETKRKKTQIDREIQEESTSWEEGGKRQHKDGKQRWRRRRLAKK